MAAAAAVLIAMVPASIGCPKTFTLRMDERAARAIYAGARPHPLELHDNRRLLRRLVRCQRRDRNAGRARRYNAARRGEWRQRRRDATAMRPALASWYGTDGTGACGVGSVQTGYRFASLFLACGTVVRFCHAGYCADGIMSDHGPYVYGRSFDLNYNLKTALACPGLCWLTYRVLP
jgi:hypothetical protein